MKLREPDRPAGGAARGLKTFDKMNRMIWTGLEFSLQGSRRNNVTFCFTAETQRTRRFHPWERTLPACLGVQHPARRMQDACAPRSPRRKSLAACKGFSA